MRVNTEKLKKNINFSEDIYCSQYTAKAIKLHPPDTYAEVFTENVLAYISNG